MDDKTYTEAVSRMEKTLSSLKTDLNKIRTGRASLALFDPGAGGVRQGAGA